MIKTVIFDIGNVLMEFSWWPYVRSLFDEDTARVITDAFWKTGYWEEFDRGVLSYEEIVKLMEEAAPEYVKEIHLTLERVGECMRKHDYAIPWIKQLKEMGYQVVFLSNYSEFLMKLKPEVLDFLPYMDGGVFSCHVKLIKPDPAIYQVLCDKCNLVPEESLFVDDNAANIESAKKFGLHAIRFEGYEKSYGEVMEYLAERNK
ncbi:MAG: HAD family phosphatase [Lachnospiraceae bacterium]|nr:HAD family phosphatase [Lachnospiraceae bacterium]